MMKQESANVVICPNCGGRLTLKTIHTGEWVAFILFLLIAVPLLGFTGIGGIISGIVAYIFYRIGKKKERKVLVCKSCHKALSDAKTKHMASEGQSQWQGCLPAEQEVQEHHKKALASSYRVFRGRSNIIIDFIGNILSLEMKIILLCWRVGNHSIPPDIENSMQAFMHGNDLRQVVVRLNQYEPRAELRQLFKNTNIWLPLRLALGMIWFLFYTFVPGRIFAVDCYCPWTNTVHLYSGHVGIALHELGHAKDYSKQSFPGLYSLLSCIPVICLVQEWRATRYAIKWLEQDGTREELKSAYRILYPAFATYIGSSLVPPQFQQILFSPFVLLGHFLGAKRAEAVV